MNSAIGFGIFDLVGVIMLVLSGTSFLYLLRVKNKSHSTWMLLWFFLCVIFSSLATLITNVGTAWDWAFAPSQDALIILGGLFLVRFAYLFPQDNQPGESRRVLLFYSIIAFIALFYAISFAIRYFANLPGDLDENQAFYLLTPISLFFLVIVFFRRSIVWSSQAQDSSEIHTNSITSSYRALLKPSNRAASALRNYGLALAIGLIPVVAVVMKVALPAVVATILFNFGAVVAIAALMLTYLNFTPEPVTLSAKLVGISLVSVLLILGITGVWVYQTIPGIAGSGIVSTFILLVLLSSAMIILVFPYFFHNAILGPIDRLLAGVKSANDGNLHVQVEVAYDDEIGYLTQSFNRMIVSLREATIELEDRASILETEVRERNIELIQANAMLGEENKVREKAEARLNKQLRYQQTLAGCSQSLLLVAEDDSSQQRVLNKALEQLRSGADASRAYIIRVFEDPELGPCAGILAEVCAPGIHAHIDHPVNQRLPLARFPSEMVSALEDGNPFGGPVKRVFDNAPVLRDNFLAQINPLLSLVLFPIFQRDQWWGFVGFDDCITEREWEWMEIEILRTASEMIGNTLQRWEIESLLRVTLDELEMRVKQRTEELSKSNILLNAEIQQRQRAQSDLETRLQIEGKLAAISARLLETTNIGKNIAVSLEDVAHVMNAGRIFLIEGDFLGENRVRDYLEWHRPEMSPISEDVIVSVMKSSLGFQDHLRENETIIIEDTSQLSNITPVGSGSLQGHDSQSLLLSPIIMNQQVQAVLGCSNLLAPVGDLQMNLRVMELVAGMLKSLLQREQLIRTLEEQVAERTRQLTTFLDMAMLSDQAQDLAGILQSTLQPITQLAGCDACGIHIIDENKSGLYLIAQRGIPLEYLQPLRKIELNADFSSWLGDADPNKALGNPVIDPMFPESLKISGYSSFIATRLSTGRKSSGVLSCYRVAELPFSPFQAALLTALGELLGIIVENYHLRVEASELAAIEERQRLAREIHDAVSQSVYSLSLFARSANDAVNSGNDSKLLSNLQDIEATSLQAMREMRLLLYQLREAGQDDDIAAALEARFKQVEYRLGIQATCEIGADIMLPPPIKHEVWRIIIEGLNNVVKHASASHISVRIDYQDQYLIASIHDDGIGFDIRGKSSGMGLENMRTRAEKIGGRLEISSVSGQGTDVCLKIPVG